MTTQKAPALPALPPVPTEVVRAFHEFKQQLWRSAKNQRSETDHVGQAEEVLFERIRAALAAKEPALPPDDAPVVLALHFHEAYERLAPQFGYETRHETRKFDSASANGRLMTAVAAEVLGWLYTRAALPAWRPIETAPRSYVPPLSPIVHHAPPILGLWGKSFYCVCRWGGPSQPFWIDSENRKVPFQPTHWMPLPAPLDVNGAER